MSENLELELIKLGEGDNVSPKEIRVKMLAMEQAMLKQPGALVGDCCPLKHSFAKGLYIREITMPKGMLITSKIHKYSYPYFVLRGDVSVVTEEGILRIKAPFSGITPAGTKRALYIHEETVWTTVHATEETEINKIEEEIIAKTFDELENVFEAEPLIREV